LDDSSEQDQHKGDEMEMDENPPGSGELEGDIRQKLSQVRKAKKQIKNTSKNAPEAVQAHLEKCVADLEVEEALWVQKLQDKVPAQHKLRQITRSLDKAGRNIQYYKDQLEYHEQQVVDYKKKIEDENVELEKHRTEQCAFVKKLAKEVNNDGEDHEGDEEGGGVGTGGVSTPADDQFPALAARMLVGLDPTKSQQAANVVLALQDMLSVCAGTQTKMPAKVEDVGEAGAGSTGPAVGKQGGAARAAPY
jgi:hypothetical protein